MNTYHSIHARDSVALVWENYPKLSYKTTEVRKVVKSDEVTT